MFAPTVIPKGVLSEEQEGVLTEIIQEDHALVVDDFAEYFVHWPKVTLVIPTMLVFKFYFISREN